MTQTITYIVAIATILAVSNTATAALGDQESSCEHDRVALGGTRTMTQEKSYRVHIIQTNGALIKEYVTNSGQVFAVSWRGISHPNLSVLLGPHYQEFNALATSQVPSRGRAPSILKTTHAVVMRGGHMRDVHGKAYLPASLPQGIQPEELL
jgi:hypothetical protein